MNIEQFIQQHVSRCIESLYGDTGGAPVQIQKTRKEFEGDMTLVVFPLLKLSRKSPEATAEEIGSALVGAVPEISGYNVIKGFLNISLSPRFWAERLNEILSTPGYGRRAANGRTVMVEYSSPNTNKPLHLGHVRNNLLGYSVSLILEAAGYRVIKVNLVNDRGIHICKSMLAWQKFGRGETPASSGKKGDHLVGDYYVAFDKAYKAEVKELTAAGMSEEEAKREAPIMREAQQMLRRWEAKDPEVYSLWETMNGWVYEGFDKTYEAMGVGFDKVYYESQTYLLGKSIVEEGLAKGVFYRRDDGSVWCDLTSDGLDEKLLLRGDGTSVYMTQDLGTALTRFREEKLDEMIYVVGNEQNYHFQVLKLILGKLGYAWADHITHLSYGMVELPEGKIEVARGNGRRRRRPDRRNGPHGPRDVAGTGQVRRHERAGDGPHFADGGSRGAEVFHSEGRSAQDDAVRPARIDRLQRQHGPVHPVHVCPDPLGVAQGGRTRDRPGRTVA